MYNHLSDVEKEYDLYVKAFENEVLLLKKGEEYPGYKYLEERNKIADSVDSALKKIILIERNERNRKMELSEKLSYRVLRNSTLTAFLVIVAGLVFVSCLLEERAGFFAVEDPIMCW